MHKFIIEKNDRFVACLRLFVCLSGGWPSRVVWIVRGASACAIFFFFYNSLWKEQGLHKIARLLIPVCNHTEINYIIMGVIIKGVM